MEEFQIRRVLFLSFVPFPNCADAELHCCAAGEGGPRGHFTPSARQLTPSCAEGVADRLHFG